MLLQCDFVFQLNAAIDPFTCLEFLVKKENSALHTLKELDVLLLDAYFYFAEMHDVSFYDSVEERLIKKKGKEVTNFSGSRPVRSMDEEVAQILDDDGGDEDDEKDEVVEDEEEEYSGSNDFSVSDESEKKVKGKKKKAGKGKAGGKSKAFSGKKGTAKKRLNNIWWWGYN